MSLSVVTAGVVAFLQKVPPFQFLSPAELGLLANSMTVEYFPRDTVILTAGKKAAESLYVVQKGGVKLSIRSQAGKELILDMRSEGEIFGLLSILGRDVARLDVTAVEDTICYGIPGPEIQKLIPGHAEVADFFFRTSVTRYMDRSLAELREQSHLLSEGERLLYSLAVSDVVSGGLVTCCRTTPIREAARMLSAGGGTCVIVVDDSGRAAGIVTEKDFAVKVVAAGTSPDAPVEGIMSAPVVAVESHQMLFQALLAMLGHSVHHLLVTEGGLPRAMLSHHHLMLLQGKSPLNLVRHIEQQRTLDDLAAAQERIGNLMPLLMREGAKASHITRVVAEVNDRLTGKILALAEAELGPPPAPYCWVVLGSEGRSEQTFKTDQDNALIYRDGAPVAYYTRLAEFARRGLERCGYPPCEGGYMASNPRWCQPLSCWRDYFSTWIGGAERRSAEDALIFFDMRPVAGDSSLSASLASHVRGLVKAGGLFQSVLAYVSIDHKPPLGFFRTFVVERTGEHKHEFDLKLHGTGPIVNAARLLALAAGLEQTNTVDRLAALEHVPGQDAALLKELAAAFEFLTMLRLESQLRQARDGRPVSNYHRPEALTNLQKATLKQAFQSIVVAQSQIDARFRSAEWSQLAR